MAGGICGRSATAGFSVATGGHEMGERGPYFRAWAACASPLPVDTGERRLQAFVDAVLCRIEGFQRVAFVFPAGVQAAEVAKREVRIPHLTPPPSFDAMMGHEAKLR